MGLDRGASGRGGSTLEISVDPNRKQWCWAGALQAVPAPEGRLASLPYGGQSLGEGFLPLAAGNPQRGLSRALATPQPSSWGKEFLRPERETWVALKHPLQGVHLGGGMASSPRWPPFSHHYWGTGIGAGLGPGALCIRILSFPRRAGWFGQKMLTLCSGLDSPGQGRTPHLPLVTPTAAFAGVGGLGLGLPTPVSPAPGKWHGGDEWAPSLFSDRPGSLLTGWPAASFQISTSVPWSYYGLLLVRDWTRGQVNGAGCRRSWAAGAASWGCWGGGQPPSLPTCRVLPGVQAGCPQGPGQVRDLQTFSPIASSFGWWSPLLCRSLLLACDPTYLFLFFLLMLLVSYPENCCQEQC